ncbi:hypothetical protein AN958_04857 [Leucoagaricus sp. SymC.cos]|nr:hypothetical protein AN958_04857 [Leucoagaricus sp. SymC.cos]
MNNPLVSETTPLLPVQHSSDDFDAALVIPVVQALETADLSHIRWEDLTPRPIPASLELDQCKRLAFALIVLLQLRRQRIAWDGRYPDAYEQWTEEEARTRDVETLEEKLSELWENFLAQYHGSRELYDVLWTQFPLKQGQLSPIRVVDFLVDRDAPQKFVAHPIVSMTMSRTWHFGQPTVNQPQSLLPSLLNTDASPCKIHFLELLFDLGFMLLLLNYVIRPPNWPDSESKWQNPAAQYPYTAREVCIVIYALSVLVSAHGLNIVLSAFVLITFAISSTLPIPGSLCFCILLWVIFFRFFMYHIPTILPTPLLLVEHQRSFPLAKFLIKGLVRIIGPLFRFYLPIALIASVALSISMSGPLTGPLVYFDTFHTSLSSPGPDIPIIGVAPMDTRILFFLLGVAVWLLILSSAYIIGSSTPIAPPTVVMWSSSTAWDVYTQEIGHEARIASYRATVTYSMDHPFPQPFNLVELVFVTIPVGLARIFRNNRVKRVTIARPVWSVTVRPLMMILTPICAFLA